MTPSRALQRLLAAYTDDVDRRAARVVAVLAAALLFPCAVGIGLTVHWNAPLVTAGIACAAVASVLTLALVAAGRLRVAEHLLVASSFLLITVVATLGQGIHDYTVMAYPIVVVVAGLLGNSRRYFLLVSGMTCVALTWLVAGESLGWFVPIPSSKPDWADWVMVITMALMSIFIMDLMARHLREGYEATRQQAEGRRLAEAAARSTGELFTRAFNASPVTLVIARLRDGLLLEVNQAFVRLTGYGRDEALGKTNAELGLLVDPGQRDAFVERLGRDLAFRAAEVRFRFRDGSVHVCDVSTEVIELDGDRCALTAMVDVTDRVEAERDRKHLEARLFQAQRLESIGTLAAGVAHDFNNILNIILGNTELLEDDGGAGPDAAQRIASIKTASARGAQLVRQLLTLARKTDTHRVPVALNDMVSEVVRLIGETFPKTIVLAVDLRRGLPTILADQGQLHQVLLNLCLNARDAMPAGGTLGLATSVVTGQEMRARWPEADAPGYVCIRVRDTGTGMDDATRRHVFDPFFTTKEVGKGTGLGLSVVQGIVHAHAGFIDLQSRIGAGTTFEVFLPVSAASAQDGRADDAPLQRATGSGETILVVEDEALARDFVVTMLTRTGYRVLAAADGAEGVEVFKARGGEIDAVISDFGLPKFNGHEVCARIRYIDPSMPFILMSGFVDPDRQADALSLGMDALVAKPFRAQELLAALRGVIERRRRAGQQDSRGN
jgi:two-component system, cell cycle sensor histidine kinase and response regulator CckA